MQPVVTFPPTFSETFSNTTQATPASPEAILDELIHDLRQPLCAIENHAYVLQLSATDAKVCTHLQAIQRLVAQAHSILEQVSSAVESVSAR